MLTNANEYGFGEAHDGYTVQNASAALRGETWTAILFVNNFADKYAKTSAHSSREFIELLLAANEDPVNASRESKDVLPPWMFGQRLNYKVE